MDISLLFFQTFQKCIKLLHNADDLVLGTIICILCDIPLSFWNDPSSFL